MQSYKTIDIDTASGEDYSVEFLERRAREKNLGALPRWWAIQWAQIKAEFYTWFHWDTRTYLQRTWIEDRRKPEITSEYLILDEVPYREIVHFVGVVRGYEAHNSFQVVKAYYGDPKL